MRPPQRSTQCRAPPRSLLPSREGVFPMAGMCLHTGALRVEAAGRSVADVRRQLMAARMTGDVVARRHARMLHAATLWFCGKSVLVCAQWAIPAGAPCSSLPGTVGGSRSRPRRCMRGKPSRACWRSASLHFNESVVQRRQRLLTFRRGPHGSLCCLCGVGPWPKQGCVANRVSGVDGCARSSILVQLGCGWPAFIAKPDRRHRRDHRPHRPRSVCVCLSALLAVRVRTAASSQRL